jgi:hypothetical protein
MFSVMGIPQDFNLLAVNRFERAGNQREDSFATQTLKYLVLTIQHIQRLIGIGDLEDEFATRIADPVVQIALTVEQFHGPLQRIQALCDSGGFLRIEFG